MVSMFQHYTGFTITLGLLRRSLYLPPAKEVWGKVMFLHVSVNHSERGGGLCMMSLPVWLPGPMFLWEGGCLQREEGCAQSPPEPEKRAVRILLEYFLVKKNDDIWGMYHFWVSKHQGGRSMWMGPKYWEVASYHSVHEVRVILHKNVLQKFLIFHHEMWYPAIEHPVGRFQEQRFLLVKF